MTYYLVRAKPKPDRLSELQDRLQEGAFIGLRPFGKALTHSLKELVPSRTELRYGRKKITAHRPWQKSVPPCLITTSMRSVSSEWTLARDGSRSRRCRN